MIISLQNKKIHAILYLSKKLYISKNLYLSKNFYFVNIRAPNPLIILNILMHTP